MFLESGKTAYIFPGQGSQAVGMGVDLADAYPIARQIFDRADSILDFSISRLMREGPEEELNDTINTQPAMMAASVASLAVFSELYPDFEPAFVAGHSMGELSALVAARAMTYPHALRLVRRRGELMKLAGENSPGGMAAVFGLDIPILERICLEASQSEEVVQIANDNCPGQVVISGNSSALERALQLAQKAGARRVKPLLVSIAAHSQLMEHIQTSFAAAVDEAHIVDPWMPLVGNVSVKPLTAASEIRIELKAQLTSPVRWSESVKEMIAKGVTTFVEFGNGTVLTGLVRRIDPQVECLNLGTPADFEKLLNT